MIPLQTPVSIDKGLPPLKHGQQIMLLGSCFADRIGTWLDNLKFVVDVNPYGILYNPLSMSSALKEIMSCKTYVQTDLVNYRGQWHSMMHHSDFSGTDPLQTLQKINERQVKASNELNCLDWLVLTWGTAFAYTWGPDGKVISNCHKMPERSFSRRLLTVDEIVAAWEPLLQDLKQIRPNLRVILTVSPIRHLRDGLHENQLSKSTLLLAIHELLARNAECGDSLFYFPSYELLMDELRDYRFYAEDMVHPSELAVKYIQQRFAETYFDDDTRQIIKECDAISRGIAHHPFDAEGENYQEFLRQLLLKIERINNKYPSLNFEKEIEICHIRLKK